MKAYGIKDEKGTIWKEELSFDKFSLIQVFIQNWLPRCKVDNNSAWNIWQNSFAKSGWTIIEFDMKESS